MGYFWRQQDDIPQGMGYPLFGVTHLISVAVTLLAVVILVVLFLRLKDAAQRRFLKAIPVLMLGMEIFKDFFLISVHRFGVWYLPLHICSFGIFVFLLREWLPWQWTGDFFGEVAFIVILPGSVAALFFADWTIYYPVWNFMNLYSYVWHGLLVLYPVLIKIRGDIRPSIRHIHYVLLFLVIVVPPVYAFDKRFNCNFFFLNWPVPGSPLEWLEAIMGNPGYLAGYAALVVCVILGMYAGILAFEKRV